MHFTMGCRRESSEAMEERRRSKADSFDNKSADDRLIMGMEELRTAFTIAARVVCIGFTVSAF
jgi:hypothetical protein